MQGKKGSFGSGLLYHVSSETDTPFEVELVIKKGKIDKDSYAIELDNF